MTAMRKQKKNPCLNQEVCVICSHVGGALRQSPDKRWVHVACTYWTPEAHFKDLKHLSKPILSDIPKERWRLSCSACKKKGACVQCLHPHCYEPFHAMCAQTNGWYFDHFEKGEYLEWRFFCGKHDPRRKKTVPRKATKQQPKIAAAAVEEEGDESYDHLDYPCVVCDKRNDEDKMVLCDRCDKGYHIFCLTPPLSTIPETEHWYCKACEKKLRAAEEWDVTGIKKLAFAVRSLNDQEDDIHIPALLSSDSESSESDFASSSDSDFEDEGLIPVSDEEEEDDEAGEEEDGVELLSEGHSDADGQDKSKKSDKTKKRKIGFATTAKAAIDGSEEEGEQSDEAEEEEEEEE
eukprot:GILJ01008705.1.p1 GENE.GILJ01008705.1~~GILJ01008705.1.p1  ORF type:complete len:404 (-),score=75.78 GILJ01008705.1:593-1639(-)